MAALRPGLAEEPRDPVLASGRARLRVVAAVFALAFLSIGLRLLDMVGWQAEREPRAVAAGSEGQDATPAMVSRADIVDRNGLVLATNNRRELARIGGLQLADWIEGG